MSVIPAGLAEGQWNSRWYEFVCGSCGCALAAREPPPRGESIRCASCRGDFVVESVQRTFADLSEERNVWKLRALKAEHELREACDAIAELRAMLERAHGADL